MAQRGKLTPLSTRVLVQYVQGITPLIVHRFCAKSMHQMIAAQMGLPNKKDKREPELDYVRSVYLMPEERFGFPCSAFKKALVRGAKLSSAMAMTDARSAFFVQGEMVPSLLGTQALVELVGAPTMHASTARNDNGQADFRFRACFNEWAVRLELQVNASGITQEQLGEMIQSAGFGIGVGEYRREKGENLGAWQLCSEKEYNLIKSRAEPGRRAWFVENAERIARVQIEDRRLLELILQYPEVQESAEHIMRKHKPKRNGRALEEVTA